MSRDLDLFRLLDVSVSCMKINFYDSVDNLLWLFNFQVDIVGWTGSRLAWMSLVQLVKVTTHFTVDHAVICRHEEGCCVLVTRHQIKLSVTSSIMWRRILLNLLHVNGVVLLTCKKSFPLLSLFTKIESRESYTILWQDDMMGIGQ